MAERRPPFAVLGIDHVVFRVADMARAIGFYRDVLGLVEERRLDELGLVQLRAGRTLIDLVDVAGTIGRAGGPPPRAEGHNVDHVALRIEPFEPAAIAAHLAAHGVTGGEVVTRYGAEGEGPSLYITDADGNTLELKGPPG